MDIRERCRGARVLLLSPHLDDAVWSCGELIAELDEPLVATVFAGVPADGLPLTDWDRQAGFEGGAQAVRERRHEDAQALAVLHAELEHLSFMDSQYDTPPPVATIAQALRELLQRREPDVIVAPLGLHHGDHILVADAVLAVRAAHCIAYEDVPYRRRPGLVQQRLTALQAHGVRATPLAFRGSARDRKREAVLRYASQWRAFGPGGCADAWEPEGYWTLEMTDGR